MYGSSFFPHYHPDHLASTGCPQLWVPLSSWNLPVSLLQHTFNCGEKPVSLLQHTLPLSPPIKQNTQRPDGNVYAHIKVNISKWWNDVKALPSGIMQGIVGWNLILWQISQNGGASKQASSTPPNASTPSMVRMVGVKMIHWTKFCEGLWLEGRAGWMAEPR